MLNKLFQLKKNNTSVTAEVLAGITTFITMAYILAVMPAMLSQTGMDKEAIFLATCLSAGVVTIAMGLVVNFPIALAPGLGLGAYFAAIANQSGGIPWQIALGIVFISGLIFLLLTITKVRQILLEAIPKTLQNAMVVGIGLFITFIGLKMSHLIVLNTHIGPSFDNLSFSHGIGQLSFFEWDLALGNFTKPDALLAALGLLVSAILLVLKVRGGILLGIIFTTLVGIPLGLTNIHDIHFNLPSIYYLDIGAMDIRSALSFGYVAIIFTFTFVGLLDTFGTLVSTADKAKISHQENGSRLIGRAMFIDAAGACFGAFIGVPALTVYIESMAGISAGGRTGLTAVTTGILFLLSLFLSSLFVIIPNAATAPALILVGVFMIASIREIKFDDFSDGVPAFLTIIIMPFAYSIANGIAVGILSYVVLKLIAAKWQQIHWMMYFLAALVLIKFIFFN